MKKLLLLAVAICLTLALTALAQTTGEVPVTSTITDSVPVPGSPDPFYMQIRSDLGGPYQSVKLRKDYRVKSVIQGNGSWEMDTGINVTSPMRGALIDFSKGIPGTGPNGGAPVAPFSVTNVRPKFLSEVWRYGYSMLTMTNGQTEVAPLLIGFDDPATGVRYRIHMTPDNRSLFPYPETDYVDITCTGVDASSQQCNQWQIRPNGYWGGCATGDDPCSVKQNVVRLVKVVSSKGKITEVNQGNFHMSFAFDITRP